LLHDPESPEALALEVDLESARAASDALDRVALSSVGIDSGPLGPWPSPTHGRGRPPLTSGARAALKRSVHEALAVKARTVEARHLLFGILSCERPDPAAELLAELGVSPVDVRTRLDGLTL
jgi:hypothetical protein